ncbi:MAG: hypothetical protein HY696_12880 [Deltaproteobacteria bacterium]|nr:hypothetical protein [Deltaproteobacteria bacterium]
MGTITSMRHLVWCGVCVGLVLGASVGSAEDAIFAPPVASLPSAPVPPGNPASFDNVLAEIQRIDLITKGNALYVDLQHELERERILQERRFSVGILVGEYQQRTQELEQLRQRMDTLQQGVGGQLGKQVDGNDNLKLLITLYESIKPNEAAELLKRLPLGVSVTMMQRMSPRKASKVLSALDPKVAAEISRRLIRNPTAALSVEQVAAATAAAAGRTPPSGVPSAPGAATSASPAGGGQP